MVVKTIQLLLLCVKKIWHPTISAGGSCFKIRWRDNVTAMKITGQDCIIWLLECCDRDLRKDLTRAAGGTLTTKTEEVVLATTEILAVREENGMVARVTLHEM